MSETVAYEHKETNYLNRTEPYYHNIREAVKAAEEASGITELERLKIENLNAAKYIKTLEAINTENEEKLRTYIPRRRVRRIFKDLRTVLEKDIKDENKEYVNQLRELCIKIDREGPQTVGNDIRMALEHVLGSYEINVLNEPDPIQESISEAVQKALGGI